MSAPTYEYLKARFDRIFDKKLVDELNRREIDDPLELFEESEPEVQEPDPEQAQQADPEQVRQADPEQVRQEDPPEQEVQQQLQIKLVSRSRSPLISDQWKAIFRTHCKQLKTTLNSTDHIIKHHVLAMSFTKQNRMGSYVSYVLPWAGQKSHGRARRSSTTHTTATFVASRPTTAKACAPIAARDHRSGRWRIIILGSTG